MPEHNIVSLNEYSKRRTPISAENRATLSECGDMLASGIARVLSKQSEAMENSLVSLADGSPLMDARQLYFECHGALHQRGSEIFQACKQAFLKAFDQQTGSAEPARLSLGDEELSLVDDTDLELTLAANKAGSRLRYHCAEELVGLDVRIGALTGKPHMTSDENPLGPRAVCESILDGFNGLGLEQRIKILLLNQFDLVLYPELPGLYQEINKLLVSRGVMPDIKVGVRSSPAHARHSHGRHTEQSELMSMFEQIVQTAGSPGAVIGSAGAPMGLPVTNSYIGHFAGAMPGVSGLSTLQGMTMREALHQLQGGSLSLPSGVTIDLRPVQAGGAISNVVRELQQSPVMLSASHLEAVLIDAVAMLFDYLFEDRAIPDHVKPLIAQLQLPVLKAAIIDRSFFTQRDNPVRKVLDLIGSLAVTKETEASASDPLIDEVKAVIETIVTDYEQDSSVFEQAVSTLLGLKARREQEFESSMAGEIEDMQRTERSENAESVALEHLRRALSDQPAPAPIVNFLNEVWTQLLKREYVEGGESSPRLSAHIETMRELLWSVQPKSDMDGRLMLVRILPGLLKRLREGVEASPMTQQAAETFFAELVALHAHAVRANPQSVPLPEAEVLFDGIPETQPLGLPEAANAEAQASAAETAIEAAEIDDEFSERASLLQKGDWVEFHYDDGTFRWARLGWISGLKGQYLFSDADGLNTFSITPKRLAEKLRNGEAVLVERRSPTDTAFGKLVNLLKQKLSPT